MEAIGWVLLAMVGLAVLSTPKLLIDLAWEREGKWLTAALCVHVVCLVLVGIVGSYALIVGVAKLWDESWQVFLISAGALAFVIYFYIAKGEAERKTGLTPKLADEIVRQYGAALARGCPDDGIARYESYLPCSKEKIKQAFKLELAFLIEHESLTQKNYEQLAGVVMYLDCFVPDEKADRINRGGRSLENKEYWKFATSMISVEIREEIDKFIEQVEGLDKDDVLFHQRVYTLIGLEYSPAVKKSFWDFFSEEISGQ